MVSEEEYNRVLAAATARYSAGEDIEDLVLFLRNSEFSVIECVRVVRTLTASGLAEAKRTVHLSKAWEDVREKHEEFHEELVRHIEEMEGSQSGDVEGSWDQPRNDLS